VGYYRKFIRSYGEIAAPLTQLLKKEAFAWSPGAASAFEALKTALTTVPVLQLPDFTKPFTVDCDASGSGFDAILHQGVGPITFFSRAISPHHAKLAAYGANRARQSRPPLEVVSLDKAVRRAHRSLQLEIPARPASVNNPPTRLGEQVIRLPAHGGIQIGPSECRRRHPAAMRTN
jgi:hypothetical protein